MNKKVKKLPAAAIALPLLYLGAILPKVNGKRTMQGLLGTYYAHRGLHDNSSDAPENSMAAFKKAVDAGYGIELDVQMTADHVPVVFHDFTLARVARNEDGTVPEGKISDHTYTELKRMHLLQSDERIPRFEEVLRLIDGKVPLLIEYKVELFDLSVCTASDALLRSYNGPYCIESFNPLVLFWYRRHRPEVARGQLSDAFRKDKPDEFKSPVYGLFTYLVFNFLTGPHFIAYNHHYRGNLSRRLCRALYGSAAFAWTIRSQQELEDNRKAFDAFIFDSFIPEE